MPMGAPLPFSRQASRPSSSTQEYPKTFFSRPDSHMRVIFASPETPFYEEMGRMSDMTVYQESASVESTSE